MKLIVTILLFLQLQFVPGTLYETCDNIATFETLSGNIYECYYTGDTLKVGNYILIFVGEELIGFELEEKSSSSSFVNIIS